MKYLFTLLFLFTVSAIAQEVSEPEQLMQADRAFDLAVSQHGVDAWISFFAPNGSMIGDTSQPIVGREAIRKVMAPIFALPSFSLRWKPVHAEMMIPGRVGYTIGKSERRRKNSDGAMTLQYGTYATVWMKQPDSTWKAVFDTGCSDGPARVIDFLLFPSGIFAQPDAFRAKIDSIVSASPGVIGVAIELLESGDSLTVNPLLHLPMQSVYKFPVALAVLNRVDHHLLSLDQMIRVTKTDLLPDTWSPLRERYPAGNVDLPLREILSAMISQSDNNGCDILFRLLGGTDSVQAYIRSLGITGIAIAATEEQMHKDWNVQFANWCEPKAMLQLLKQFYLGNILSSGNTAFLRTVMERTGTGPGRIRGQLPPGTLVSHKTGSSGENEVGIAAATNDVGIVTLPDGRHYVIVVFVSNSTANEDARDATISSIARAAWDFFLTH
ncbi:MAG: class A beta-lactamase, subclass A2 [Ignavibacteriales bacterium]|nr:class A beta-lactamase, subclass A2 [Ignavibacteriales bacterium]